MAKNPQRRFVSLLTAFSFAVLAITGILAFVRPFSLQVVGLHALMGFVFVGLIVLHVINNVGHLSRYLRSKALWITSGLILLTTILFSWQPGPVKRLLGLSRNLGPSLDRFEMTQDALIYQYHPSPNYRMSLAIQTGAAFDLENPPQVAIWLENASFYHIKTLHHTGDDAADARAALPYWDYKVRGWEEARRQAEADGKVLGEAPLAEVDAITEPTRNSSFDPADYILPPDSGVPMPYQLLVEIDQPGDGQPSLVYSVEIDNADPRIYQLLDLVGSPKREMDGEDGKEEWALYFVDDRFDTALDLIDSALLRIDR